MLDHDLYIIHATSLNRKNKIKLNFPKNINLIDLSYTNFKSIMNLLNIKNSILFITGHNSLIEFALVNYFKLKNRKCIYIQHGYYLEESKFFINDYYAVLKKYLLYSLYFSFALIKNPKLVIDNFLTYLKYKTEYSFCDINFFFDKNSLSELRASGEKISIGYPLGVNNNSMELDNEMATIVHQCFIADKLSNVSYKEEREFYKMLTKILKKNGYKKINFLLHPREALINYERYKDYNINVIQGLKSQSILFQSNLIIGHYSSLIFHSIFIGKNVIRVDYPGIDNEVKNSGAIPIRKLEESQNVTQYYISYNGKGENNTIDYDTFAEKIIKYANIS